MKLIHKQTGKIVREGDIVTDFRGDKGIVLGWTKPHSPASTGRITVDVKGIEHYCYPEVYFCEWINREDRLEEKEEEEKISVFGIPYETLGSPNKSVASQPTSVGGLQDFKPDWSSLEVFPSAPIKPIYKDTSSLPPVSSFDRTAQLMTEVEDELNRIQETLNQIKHLLS